MEQIVRNVRDIGAGDRSALEHVLGQALRENQRLIIQITEVDVARETPVTDTRQPQTLNDWTKVYEGLTDEQIDEIEAAILDRDHWTRNSA